MKKFTQNHEINSLNLCLWATQDIRRIDLRSVTAPQRLLLPERRLLKGGRTLMGLLQIVNKFLIFYNNFEVLCIKLHIC